MKSYPPGLATRRASQQLLERVEPFIFYVSPDNELQWFLNCMEPVLMTQEGVALADGVGGLHPSFQHIDHKSARQPGVKNQRTVYDPAEYDMDVEITAPPNHTNPEIAAAAIRRVIRHWIESFDPEVPGKLVWVTPDMGRWSCRPRLFRAPPDKQFKQQARRLRQKYQWVLRNDSGFWEGPKSISTFRLSQSRILDRFDDREDPTTLGPQWSSIITGDGDVGVEGGAARWFPDGVDVASVRNRLLGINEIHTISIIGEFTSGTWTYTINGQTTSGISLDASAAAVQTAIEALSNVAPGDVTVTGDVGGPWTVTFKGALAYSNIIASVSGAGLAPSGTAAAAQLATKVDGSGPATTSDFQSITVKLGEVYQFPFPPDGAFDIMGRWNTSDASPTMVRARVFNNRVVLSRFNTGIENVMYTFPSLSIPPMFWEEWTLVCGVGTNARHFKLLRNGYPVQDANGNLFSYKETGTGSALGSGNRGSGWGYLIGAGPTQQVPPTIDQFYVGENVKATQTGHLTLTNFGDQLGQPNYLVYGPFDNIRIANGPDSSTFIEFGPLADGQIAWLPTVPRLRGVVDLSADQPEQVLTGFQDFIDRLFKLAVSGDIPPLLEWFESLLGIQPPQGELYHLLRGRFTKGIPKKPAGIPPTPVSIACEIVGGNADSKIVAGLTPLRRWPE